MDRIGRPKINLGIYPDYRTLTAAGAGVFVGLAGESVRDIRWRVEESH